MFRWGCLSTAKIARTKMIPAIQASENGIVTAIASLNPGRAEEAAAQFDIGAVYDSYDALLASDAVDGVYIPVPTSQHTEWVLKAIAAGKHVLCEKPIAMDAADIDRIIAARDASGLTVAEAFMVTYHPQWHHVRDLIAKGAIGRLRHVEGAFTYRNTDPDSTRNRKDMGGGALPDIGVYPLITTRFATGAEPVRLRSRVDLHPEWGTDIYAEATLEFEDFTLSFYTSTEMALRQSMVFHGTTGRITVAAPFNAGDYAAADVHLDNETADQRQTAAFHSVDQYQEEAEAFVRAATGEADAVLSLENSRQNQRIIDAVFEAGRTGNWVSL